MGNFSRMWTDGGGCCGVDTGVPGLLQRKRSALGFPHRLEDADGFDGGEGGFFAFVAGVAAGAGDGQLGGGGGVEPGTGL